MTRPLITSIAILYTLLSCTKKQEPVQQLTTPIIITPTTDTSKKILTLGDSYTIGQSVLQPETFPYKTVSLLKAAGLNFDAPEVIAQTGWTTGNLSARLDAAAPLKNQYNIVTLLIGVNNQYQGLSQAAYRTEFTTLLYRAIGYVGNNKSHMIVISIPDYSVTPFANGSDKAKIAREIDEFNTINQSVSQSIGVNYLDITPSTRMAATDPGLIAYDGLHPSGKEYEKWARLLVPIIKSVL